MTKGLRSTSTFGVSWSQFLREHEESVQKERLALLEERKRDRKERREKLKKLKEENADNENESIPTEINIPAEKESIKSYNPIKAIHRSLQFEFYHTIPALLTLLTYCTAHLSVYELLNSIFVETIIRNYAKTFSDEFYFYCILLSLGLILSRFSGGVFSWMGDDLYECAKFDMHNRNYQNTWDALLFKFLSRKYPRVKMVLSIVSLYFCFISMGFYIQRALPMEMDARVGVLENLPSVVWRRENILEEEKMKGVVYDVFGCGEKTSMHTYLLEGYLTKRNLTLQDCTKKEENGDLNEEESYYDGYLNEGNDSEDEQEEELPGESCSNEDETRSVEENECVNRKEEEDYDKEEDYEGKEHTANSKELTRLSGEDETYLYSKITMSSYYALVGDSTTGIVSLGGTVFFYGVSAFLSLYALKRVGVPFWE